MPAAPAPMITTFFLSFLTRRSEDMVAMLVRGLYLQKESSFKTKSKKIGAPQMG